MPHLRAQHLLSLHRQTSRELLRHPLLLHEEGFLGCNGAGAFFRDAAFGGGRGRGSGGFSGLDGFGLDGALGHHEEEGR